MPSKIFRRKGSSRDSPSSSSHGHGGITIAASGAMSTKNMNAGNTNTETSSPYSLLPEPNYRTSLIMPHLKRRFTLLRAPDGTMVTPDAMRAHLRAQRARARAAGTPGAQIFLTEEEENEIIEQLRNQTHLEVQQDNDDLQDSDASFGGTDGFGSWGSPPSSPLNKINPLNGTESPLQKSVNSNDASLIGSLFSGRSSARDQAYISGVQRSRAASRSRDDAESSNSHRDVKTNLDQVKEVADTDEDDEGDGTMPGDFLLATKRASQRSSNDAAPRPSKSSSKTSKGSSLLTTLSPEAYKRVSTALEQVYDMVSGKSSSEAGVNDLSHREEETRELMDERSLAPSRSRPSVESDAHSFTSARSDVMNGNGLPADATAAIGASMMSTGDSSSTIKSVAPARKGSASEAYFAPKGTSKDRNVQQGGASSSVERAVNHTDHDDAHALSKSSISSPSRLRQISLDTANGRMRRGPPSPNVNTFTVDSGRSPKMSSIPFGSSSIESHDGQVKSPLQAGFHHGALRSNKSSASSAAATAAGIAAASYVAQHQDKSKQRELIQEISQSYHSQPVTHQIVQGGRGIASYESNMISTNSPQTLRSPSAATSSVLSADAIAARSQRYFPSASNKSAQKYADGFRAPSTPNTTNNTPSNSSDAGYCHRRQQSDASIGPPMSSRPLQQQAAHSPVTSPSQNVGVADPRYGPSESEAHQLRGDVRAYASSGIFTSGQGDLFNGLDLGEDDVWARIAANNSANDASPGVSYRSNALNGQLPQAQEAEISLDKLHEIQESLIRSASAKGRGHNQSMQLQRFIGNTATPPLPATSHSTVKKSNVDHSHKASNSFESDSADSILGSVKLEKARERARKLANQQVQIQQYQEQPPKQQSQSYTPISNSFDTAPYASILTAIQFPEQSQVERREGQSPLSLSSQANARLSSSERSSTAIDTSTPSPSGQMNGFAKPGRSQVMYDVTTSHRPMSPPLRGHKTSLSNLPSLQDLSMNANALRSALEPKHESIDSMLEANTKAHDALSKESSIDPSPLSRAIDAIPEAAGDMRASMMTFEEVKVEDGFGGFTTEKRPMLRSQSHDVLSSMLKSEDKDQSSSQSQGPASPMTPASTYSEPAPVGSQQQRSDSNPWARMNSNKESLLYDNMLDDVAAQTKAATLALKGDYPFRPQVKTRSKSFSRGSRKITSKNISQPQLMSTSQKLEYAEEVPKIDRTLTKKDFKKHLEESASQQNHKPSPQTPSVPSTLRSRTNSAGGHSATKSINTPMRPELASKRTLSSATSSPTDYKAEPKMPIKSMTSSTDVSMQRSISSGHRRAPSNAMSARAATPPASAPAHQTQTSIDVSPQSERSASGLSRFMSKLRSRRPSDISSLGSNQAAMKSSPHLSNYGTPSTTASVKSPLFVTPGEQISPPRQINESRVPPLPNGNVPTSLAGLFGPAGIPSRSSSVRMKSPKGSPPLPLPVNNGFNGKVLGSPAPIQDGFASMGKEQTSTVPSTIQGVNDSPPLPPLPSLATAGEEKPSSKKSARDTIVRRTIIISTAETAEDKRRSAAPVRKLSTRKPVPSVDDPDEKPSNSRRSSSNSRKSMQDQPSTPPDTDVLGLASGDRKTSQGGTPPVSTPPIPRNLFGSTSLAPPSPRQGSSARVSNATSEYGTSLYDMYMNQDGSEVTHQRNSGQTVPSTPSRQSLAADGGNAARHIEVTERADGSTVWQVIAGLADRSSTYSMSMLNGAHSRVASGDSTYSTNNLMNAESPSQYGKVFPSTSGNGNEDGRSLFARTRGQHRKSFSYDASVDPVPPLPPTSSDSPKGTTPPVPSPHPVGFDIANPSGGAATRIVYTSDAELASMLEALAGPDKTSAKFEFHRVRDEDGSERPVSVWTDSSQVLKSDNRSSNDLGGAGGGGSSINSSLVDSKERIRIEAEIYSLLQRDGHPQNVAATVAKQHADQVHSSTRANIVGKTSA